MEINNKLSKYIVAVENFLPERAHEKLQEILNSNLFRFEEAGLSGVKKENYFDSNVRKTESFPLSNSNPSMTVTYWSNFLGTYIMQAGQRYREVTNTDFEATITDMQILKYFKNGFYKRHIDSGIHIPRTLSFVYFINDNFKGGELSFELPSNEVIKFEVKKNKLIMFPSNFLYPHRVVPVEEGVKYSVVAWAS